MLSYLDACESIALTTPRCAAKDQLSHALALIYKCEIDDLLRVACHDQLVHAVPGIERKRQKFTVKLIDELQAAAQAVLRSHDREWDGVWPMTDEQLVIVSRAWDTSPTAPAKELVAHGKVQP